MYRKKEIIIIIVILIITILLAFSNDIFHRDNNSQTIITPSYVTVRVEGEVKEEVEIKIPYGYTYGFVINHIDVYLNDYSYYDVNLNEAIYEDVVLVILSYDINNQYDESKKEIAINTASKDELLTLYGIGEARANKIIEYRTNNRIDTFIELKELLGVSDEVIEKIKSQAVL